MTDRHAQRATRVLQSLGLSTSQAVLATNPTDVRWLSGFSGSFGMVVVSEPAQILMTDSRYAERAAAEAPAIETYVPKRPNPGALFERLASTSVRTLLVDESHLTVAALRGWSQAASDAGFAVEPVAMPFAELRKDKDAQEIEALRRACEVSDIALAEVLPQVRIGMTEKELAFLLETTMVRCGAEDRAFESIVAAGEHSAIPHHSPTSRPIGRGDLLKIDFGALVDGYHADETRTFVIGQPADWQVEIHAVVAASQLAGRQALRAGVTLQEVDHASRQVIVDAGYGENFNHGLGHGVGLQIHEEPFFSPTGTSTLAAGYVLTIEPGVYLPGQGGVRIEDTLAVGQDSAESLTTTPRELRVLC